MSDLCQMLHAASCGMKTAQMESLIVLVLTDEEAKSTSKATPGIQPSLCMSVGLTRTGRHVRKWARTRDAEMSIVC